MKDLKAILFDSGKVLNSPVTNHWFIPPNFWTYVDKNKFECIGKKDVTNAFSKAGEYIFEQKLITTKDEEYVHFLKFYDIFFSVLPGLSLSDNDIEHIAADIVFNADKYSFYEDALDIIPKLKEKYKLAVVSDAWPSLLDVFDKNDMTGYFDSFVISSFLGVTKPNKKMYIAALKELNISPSEALFIDDSVTNCKGAFDLGINTILLCRDKREYIKEKIKSTGKKYIVINNLYQLEKLL